MVPTSQHVFWLPESAFGLILTPIAALMAWWSTRYWVSAPIPLLLKRLFFGLWALWALAALLAIRKDLSFLALAEWSSYALIFFAVWRLAFNIQRRHLMVALLLAYGVLSSIYASFQFFGWDKIPWAVNFGGRSGAFLGNPNFLGGHLALLFPVALALALDQRQKIKSRWRQFLPWLTVLSIGMGLLLAQTRGAWAGAALGTVLVLALGYRHMGALLGSNRGILLGMGILALLSASSYLALQPQQAWSRLAGTFTGKDVELAHRVFLMKKASQLASLSPLVGVGPGNFRLHFPRVQVQGLDPIDYKSQSYISTEHAHNDFLQMAAETGLPAALLWAALMAAVLALLYQSIVRNGFVREASQGGLLALGVLGGVAALLVHGLANFPFLILPTQGTAWALVALALRSQAKPAVDSPPAPVKNFSWTKTLLLSLGLILCGASVVYNGRRLAMDRLWWIGQGELQLKNYDKASTWLLRALALDRREDHLWLLHGQSEQSRELIWNSIGSLREANRLNPYDPSIAVYLGRNLVENKQYAEAETVLLKPSTYAPNFYDLWEPLAASLYMQNKYAEAVHAYDWMIYFNVNGEAAYVNKAAAQGSQGQLPQALLTLEQAQQRFPDKANVYVNLAVTVGQSSRA